MVGCDNNIFERVKEALAIQPNSTIFEETNIEPILPTLVPTLAYPIVNSFSHVSLSSDLVCTSSPPSLHFSNSPAPNVNNNSLTQENTQHDINNLGHDEKFCHPSCEAFMEVIKASIETNLTKDKDKEPFIEKMKRKDKFKKKKDKACCLVPDPMEESDHNSRRVGKSKTLLVGGRSKLNETTYAEFIQAMADYEEPVK
ncbi:hypothetical protein Tco_0948531 [Tanacetum coccineum]